MTMPFAGPDVTAHPEALPYDRIMAAILLSTGGLTGPSCPMIILADDSMCLITSLTATSEAVIYLAMTRLLLRRLTRP
jgi:hypothetical protein